MKVTFQKILRCQIKLLCLHQDQPVDKSKYSLGP